MNAYKFFILVAFWQLGINLFLTFYFANGFFIGGGVIALFLLVGTGCMLDEE